MAALHRTLPQKPFDSIHPTIDSSDSTASHINVEVDIALFYSSRYMQLFYHSFFGIVPFHRGSRLPHASPPILFHPFALHRSVSRVLVSHV